MRRKSGDARHHSDGRSIAHPNGTPTRNVDDRMTVPVPIDDTVRRALARHPDGRTAIELAEFTRADYGDVRAALERLAAAGSVTRSRVRLGSWVPTGRPPGEAA